MRNLAFQEPANQRSLPTAIGFTSKRAKSPFIVREIDSRMLQTRPDLPDRARLLWLTMLAMANARTGELRHREHWFSGEEIDKRAGISDETRRKYMHLLRAAGLAYWEREHVLRVLKDRLSGHQRLRCVSGATHYFVSKTPRKDWLSSKAKKPVSRKEPILLNPSPSAAEEFGPQVLSEKHQEGESGVVQGVQGLVHDFQSVDFKNHQDDSLFPAPAMSKAEKIVQQQRAQWKPWQVEAAIWTVFRNAYNSGSTPRSAQYFVVGVENLTKLELDVIENWTEESFQNWLIHTKENLQKLKRDGLADKERQSFE